MCAVAKMVGRPNKNVVGGRAGGLCTRMDDVTNIGSESGILRLRPRGGHRIAPVSTAERVIENGWLGNCIEACRCFSRASKRSH